DINRPGLLIGITGLIFVLLGLVIVALNVQQVNTKLMNRFAYLAAPDNILPILHFNDTNSEKIEDLLKKNFNLTVREVEVASHLLLGYKNKDIQEKLCITMNTLKYHIRNIYSKLGVNNREGAVDVVYKVLNDYERQQASGKVNV
ncbi:MAG: helix-turn-helix transcriptional regulator, partial [Bacillota bacterium]